MPRPPRAPLLDGRGNAGRPMLRAMDYFGWTSLVEKVTRKGETQPERDDVKSLQKEC